MTVPTKDLVFRLAEIRKQQDNLAMEYNMIVEELWKRIPGLRDDVNMQQQELEDNKYYGRREKK